jgi:hypothetical protein
MDFVHGNLRVSYLDFRPSAMFAEESALTVEPQYTLHAMMAVAALVEANGRQGPDAFYLETSRGARMHEVSVIRSWFGDEWKGRFICADSKPEFALSPSSFELNYKPTALADDLQRRPSPNIAYVDEIHMAIPFMHTMEYKMGEGRGGQHFHHQCAVGNMHSCSAVCNMAAQQLLHAVFLGAPLPSAPPRKAEADSTDFSPRALGARPATGICRGSRNNQPGVSWAAKGLLRCGVILCTTKRLTHALRKKSCRKIKKIKKEEGISYLAMRGKKYIYPLWPL